MGWYGVGVMDGDLPMDAESEIEYFIGVKYNKDCERITTEDEIKQLLVKKEDSLYDWIRDYDWKDNGFKQEVYIQVLIQILLDYNISISKRGKKGAMSFIEEDHWAKEDKNRAKAMKKLKNDMMAA